MQHQTAPLTMCRYGETSASCTAIPSRIYTPIRKLPAILSPRSSTLSARSLQGVWSGRFDRSRKFDHCRHCMIEHFGADRLSGQDIRKLRVNLTTHHAAQLAILQVIKVFNDAMMITTQHLAAPLVCSLKQLRCCKMCRSDLGT